MAALVGDAASKEPAQIPEDDDDAETPPLSPEEALKAAKLRAQVQAQLDAGASKPIKVRFRVIHPAWDAPRGFLLDNQQTLSVLVQTRLAELLLTAEPGRGCRGRSWQGGGAARGRVRVAGGAGESFCCHSASAVASVCRQCWERGGGQRRQQRGNLLLLLPGSSVGPVCALCRHGGRGRGV